MSGATKKRKPRAAMTVTSRQKYLWVESVYADPAVSQPAKAVAWALGLKFHNNKTNRCNPGYTGLTKATCLSLRAVKIAIQELGAGGWIAVSSIGGGSPTCTNRYTPDWSRTATKAPIQPIDNIDEKQGAKTTTSEAAEINEENDPTGAPPAPVHQMHPTGARRAHEPLKNHRAPSARVVRESKISVALRAPDGALATGEDLIRPYGTKKAKAKAAYLTACREHGGEILAGHGVDIADYILASARNWTAKKTARWLPKLEDWLADGAWRNEPSPDKGSTRTNANDDAVEEMLRQGGVI
jgi:hypothetical protein